MKIKRRNFFLEIIIGIVVVYTSVLAVLFIFQRTSFNSDFFLWVIFAAISPGIIAFILYIHAQQTLGASLTGFTLYIFTIYAAIYGLIFFDEKLEPYHFAGTLLVFLGVYLAKKNYETKT